jgi:uncharacterized protein (TIGR03663 family)
MAGLDLRPMHTDEAVHAVKFGALLERGSYSYDRNEYHGPTLNYFTLLPAWLTGEKTIVDVKEATLRSVPAAFSFCALLLILLVPEIGGTASVCALLLCAFSPAMVFYGRYYIQETLLVTFAFGLIVAAFRFGSGGRTAWSIMAGACAGLMIATKETWIISAGAMGIALLGVLIVRRREMRPAPPLHRGSIAVALSCAVLVWALFFSSFLTHMQGLSDSILAFETYFTRAGENTRHGHPWYYFLQLLTGTGGDHGPFWTEGVIFLFGLAGLWSAVRERPNDPANGRDLRIFLGLYGLLMLIVCSAIPYKTPWLVLGALQPLSVSAGSGMSAMLRRLSGGRFHVAGLVAGGLLVSHLAWQAWMANFRYFDDPVNPYTYAQPGNDVREITAVVTRAVREGASPVQVVASGDDYWPLPWYFRALPNVGWRSGIGEGFIPGGVILTSPESESALLEKLYEIPPPGSRDLYVPLFGRPMFIRPGKEMRGYITLEGRNAMAAGGSR